MMSIDEIVRQWGAARTRMLLFAAFLAPLAWIFGEGIFTPRSFVFRDAAHYYYPLFQWTAAEWSQGRVPLWNPYENAGSPALADPTTSVFYPGKLLFALPLDYTARYKLYILTHVLLAGATAQFTARRWNASPVAATAAGVSYAFGGSVAFQYCNVVYLIGAAWLPLALWATDGLLRRRRWSWACRLAAVLAMMILGGDPQTAYHAGLIAVLGLWLRRDARGASVFATLRICLRRKSHAPFWKTVRRRPGVLLAGAAAMTTLLAAVQVWPSSRWTQRSERAAFTAPRTLYEVPGWWSRAEVREGSIAAGLMGQPAAGTHHEHLYLFSVGPWRWAEFLWPNFSGRMFPNHQRWISVLPAEGRVWTPSLYLGLAPLIAALAAMRLRGCSFRTRWLTWAAILSLLAALGGYGVGWLWHEVRFAWTGVGPSKTDIGAPTGGLYWLLVQTAPGYVYFRYPAKWLTVAALALSLLAARSWDTSFRGESPRARRLALTAIVASLIGMTIWLVVRPFWSTWLAATPPDNLLGPLHADNAARDLLFALLQTAIAASVLLGVMRIAGRDGRRRSLRRLNPGGSRLPLIAVIYTSFDLCLAHGWIAPTAPQRIWQDTPAAAQVIAADAHQSTTPPGVRVFRASQARWFSTQENTANHENRQVVGLKWDHASLYPKYHLAPRLPSVEVHGAMAAADYAAVLDVARGRGLVRPDRIVEPAPEALRLLGVGYWIVPHIAAIPKAERVATSLGEGELANVAVWRDSSALPRAWIVHRVQRMPELNNPSPQALAARTREVLLPGGQWRDFAREAVVETDAAAVVAGVSSEASTDSTCRLVQYQPQRIEIEFDTAAAGLLLLSDLYDADWRAFFQPEFAAKFRPLPLLRANRVFRGVPLPAGRGRVVFVYRPTAFYAGAAVSAAAWLLLGALAWCTRSARNPPLATTN